MNKEVDLLIVGAGSAGLPCAICAAQRGKKVLVIEKEKEVGGTLSITAGHLSAAGTKRQAELNINDNTDLHFEDVKRISRNTMDEVIARKAVDLAPITIDWLTDLGYPFHDRAPAIIHGHDPYSVARTYFGKDDVTPLMKVPGKTVLNVLLPIFKTLVAENKIQLITECKLTSINTNGNTIESITVEYKNEKLNLTANKFIITTGGYASNPEFFKKYTPTRQRLLSTAKMSSQGEGAEAIINIGGAFVNAEKHSSTVGGIELEPGSGRVNFWETWAKVSNGVDRKQREIYVNENGERFMNEYDLTSDQRERIVLQQPNQRFYIIFDEHALYDGASLITQWTPEQIKAEAKKEKAIWCADTLTELAQKINLPENIFLNTVNNYNTFVAQQKDEAFGRTYLEHNISQKPFYAVLVYAYSLISFGGIKVNYNLQVLDTKGIAFDNLFAAGEILGAGATSGNAFCGGMLLTPAISFGKWLGENL